YGFRFYETRELYAANQEIDTMRVWKGEQDLAGLGVAAPVHVTVPRGSWDSLVPTVSVQRDLYAPLAAKTEVGELRVMLDGEVLATAPLIVLTDIARGGLWKRMTDEVALWFE
ncbi:MAG: serine-type D-Ala-D-Ala carboxypeptidase, partial [Pseudomonadota bacterium]